MLIEKLTAEEKVKELTHTVETEHHQFAESKEALQRRLKELEIGMKLKQEVHQYVIMTINSLLFDMLFVILDSSGYF